MANWPITKCRIIVTFYRGEEKIKEAQYEGYDLKRLTRYVSRNLETALNDFAAFLRSV